jgi:hypothetical protein
MMRNSGLCTSGTKWIKTKMKTHPHVSIARGMKSLFGVHSMYDCVFSWAFIIATWHIPKPLVRLKDESKVENSEKVRGLGHVPWLSAL